MGGSENVLEQMRTALPANRTVCVWNDAPQRFPDAEETWLAASPIRGHKTAALPFMGSAWNHIDLSGTDKVVASSHAFAHHLASRAAKSGISSYAYVHSPARYVWSPDIDKRGNSLVGRLGRNYFRNWDRRHTTPEVHYAANSQFIARRVWEAWGRHSTVLYPPVDIQRITSYLQENVEQAAFPHLVPRGYVLGASRLVSYKNLEAAIRAGEILDLPVVIAGEGPDEPRLRAIGDHARVPVTFTGTVIDALLLDLYRSAALFVYMPIEDFGIMPVEAMACGTPVVVNDIGGARESVLATGGGMTTTWNAGTFGDTSVLATAAAIDMTAAKSQVGDFSNSAFREGFVRWLNNPAG